ncbi:MAG: hypothetical protein IJK54_08170 [Clostridia bacterium]|nr:hypothetical protein [Clostridia bacterium]MBQ6660248.1 hypothetical protein [Lachnospiraceae bacterium]
MKKRLLAYLQQIDELLKHPPIAVNYDDEVKKHLVQIGFFMHERLIHLIVTVLFALLAVGVALFAVASPGIPIFLLFGALLVLLIPYIMHYYLLENGVQKMYEQYDELLARSEEQKKTEAAGELQ